MTYPLPTYRGYPVVDWRPNWAGPSPGLSFHMTKTRFDAGTGRLKDDNPFQPAPRTELRIQYAVGTRAKTIELEDFILHQAQGRLKPFWLPSWSPDVKLTVGRVAADDDLIVTPFGYGSLLAGLGHGRAHVALWPRNTLGSILFREIIAHAFDVDGNEVLTLDSALGVDFDQRDGVTFLLLCRASADELIIEWQNMNVTVFELPVIDLPWETPVT